MSEDAAQPTKVVIIDDSTVIRLRLRALINSEEGMAVVGEAEDVRDGLEVLRSTRADVLVLDVMLRASFGLELLERLRRDGPDRPRVIVITNYASKALRDRSLELGADYFLTKSTEFRRIPSILRRIRATRNEYTPRALPPIRKLPPGGESVPEADWSQAW